MSKKDDIPFGQPIGFIIPIEDIKSTGSKRQIKCQCQCGCYFNAIWNNIKRGHTKSCGCLRKSNFLARSHIKTAIGQTCNLLTIVSGYVKQNVAICIAKCKCGKIKEAKLADILNGHVKSCGCLKNQMAKEYVSQVDGTLYFSNVIKNGYVVASNENGNNRRIRNTLHVLEAKKVYNQLDITWGKQVVHHIDHNRQNNNLTNLAIFDNSSEHRKHHGALAKSLYQFVSNKGLLEEFYQECPKLKLQTLQDILDVAKKIA